MKKTLVNLMVLCTVLCSCKKEGGDQPQDAVTVKVSATLNPYFGAGRTVAPVWNGTDRLVLTDAANDASGQARASMAGSATSMFSIKLDGVKESDELVGVFGGKAQVKGGSISFEIPAAQNGTDVTPVLAGKVKYDSRKISGVEMSLASTCSVLMANAVQKGYAVTDVIFETVGGEKVAGNISINVADWSYKATESRISVHIANPDASQKNISVPILLTPGTLSQGYKLIFKTDTHGDLEFNSEPGIVFRPGSYVESGDAKDDPVRKLLACGSSKVYLFNKDLVDWGQRYTSGLIWSWDCTSVQGICAGCKSSSHIDDTKIVNNKRQLLVTCSNNSGWCVLLEPDYDKSGSAKLLFWTNSAPNAHSAEYLPGGYVAVACSVSGGDCIQLYSVNKNNVPLKMYSLGSAHGAVWMEATQRLYAIGGSTLQIYKLDADKGELELENTISTSAYVTGLHDISAVDDVTLIMGGNKCALYNITTGVFTAVPHFNVSGRTGIKSLNYNAETGECFYTYATAGTAEGSYDWSSHKVRYTDNINGGGEEKYVLVDDINMYKVRVFNW